MLTICITGTLTALMGVSGAGKTTLLDVLATRVTMGVISGDIWVDGRQRDSSFQRKTGYVQQQDLHLQTTTVCILMAPDSPRDTHVDATTASSLPCLTENR